MTLRIKNRPNLQNKKDNFRIKYRAMTNKPPIFAPKFRKESLILD